MMTKKDLELEIERKVTPIVKDAMNRYLGVNIDELNEDITGKLKKDPLLFFDIDPTMPFKKAKQRFKREYLERLLKTHYGNVSMIAKIADVDRRSIHRLVNQYDIEKIRKELPRPYDVKAKAVGVVIEDVLGGYKSLIHPTRLEEVYKNVPSLSRDIVNLLPETPMSLKEAEEEFEREFFKAALARHAGSTTDTAKVVGLRYETLHRKLKKLGMV